MNNALNKTCAGTRATRRGPLVRLAAVCVMACLTVSAHAQQYGERGRFDDPQAQRAERSQQLRQERGEARQFDREMAQAREEQRRHHAQQQEQMRNSDAVRRSGRMTPDERADLRRQINEAGVELYPNSRRR
ncbi:MAG TPA: hypothetical protein VF861_01380 [Telluria sp.]